MSWAVCCPKTRQFPREIQVFPIDFKRLASCLELAQRHAVLLFSILEMFMLLKKLLFPAVLVLGLNACTDDSKKLEEPVQATTNENELKVDETTGKVEFAAEIVYFGFDEVTLTPEGMARLDAIAKYMGENPGLKLSIEGYCDDRGSTEYNLALGQRRSESVKNYLKTVGVTADKLNAVSFGEEKPAAQGETEDARAKNRRAEFTFSKS